MSLGQNAPNPFRPPTTVTYSLPAATHVRLVVYDMAGRRVKTLVEGGREAGSHEVVWDGTDERGTLAAGGIYFYRLQTGTASSIRRMIMIR